MKLQYWTEVQGSVCKCCCHGYSNNVSTLFQWYSKQVAMIGLILD